MDNRQLIEIGFTENQARVYILLFRKPGQGAGKISKELSLDRSFVYNIIDSLTKKGFIYSSLIKNKKIFYAENPQKIIEDLNEKKFKAKILISELVKIKEKSESSPKIEIYEGKQALKKYLQEIINSKEFLTLGGGGKLNIFNILKYERPHYFKGLTNKKASGKVICSETNKEFWKNNLKNTNVQVKSLEGAGKENSITILKDRVIFSSETENPDIIILNNPDHSYSLRRYFNLLWKLAKK